MNSSSKNSAQGRTLRLEIQGHVPSFKNTKSIYRTRDGRPFIATKKERKEWMEKTIQSFASQLLSAAQIITPATATGCSRLSSIVSSLPLDDSRTWIPELTVKCCQAERGLEGAEIFIEEI